MNTLILKSNRNSFEKFYSVRMQRKGVLVSSIYFSDFMLIRLVRVFIIKYLCFLKQDFWYGKWKKSIHSFSTVIIFDYIQSYSIIDFIHKYNPDCRIILWYWNTAKLLPSEEQKEKVEMWSFDLDDCKKYHMSFNNQFIVFDKEDKCNEKNEIFDVMFVGRDKGRLNYVAELFDLLKSWKLKVLCFVVKDKRKYYCPNKYLINKDIPYEIIINYIKSSKIIVDIVKGNQIGITLRVLEAVFFEKKLITNNSNIKSCLLYDEDNMYILDDDSRKLQEFCKLPYIKKENTEIEKYFYNNWIKNFNV